MTDYKHGRFLKKKLVLGVGINDADYYVTPIVDGKVKWCIFYRTWHSMITRGFSAREKIRHPKYKDVTVCDEWLRFSVFKKWMEAQDYRGLVLDKDLLLKGSKIYSPETCKFVTPMVNGFLLDCDSARGDHPIGVSFAKNENKYVAHCRNPFKKKKENLGYFDCPHKAHLAWRSRKHELACQLAELQTDSQAAEALIARYKLDVNKDTYE